MFEVALPQKTQQSATAATLQTSTVQRTKPRLRGIPDVIAVSLFLPAVSWLVLHARAGVPTVAALVYGACLIGLFTVSALYHAFMWPLAIRRIWRRVDHSMVYVLIAGSYTPVCVVALERAVGNAFLAVVWGVTALGFFKSFFWETSPRWLNTAVYVTMGWLVIPIVPWVYHGIGGLNFGLIGLGGLFYTVGALIYARRWPNPDPTLFGYHEVFHVFVILAAASHFLTMWNILT